MDPRKGRRTSVFKGVKFGESEQKSHQPNLTSAGAVPMQRKRGLASVAGLSESVHDIYLPTRRWKSLFRDGGIINSCSPYGNDKNTPSLLGAGGERWMSGE